ncbi:MAG: SAM-dependent methyltransferase [Deltaproteobacteria bacterium]|nr:SAM-dependent methyltransferase [Deltaproteobacteria bacterium]
MSKQAKSRPRDAAFRTTLSPLELRKSLQPGQSVELLQELGLVNRDGSATASANRKLKQISHFLRLLEPALADLFERHPDPVLVDAAAGKSYLGFALYDLLLRDRETGQVKAIESRAELATRATALRDRNGYARLEVLQSSILEATLPERTHLVLALHACDTATDEAIVRAVRTNADHVALVPCCQAELARQLGALSAPALPAPPLSVLWRHAWHRREFGSHLTNVLRALLLQAHGYAISVTELAGWEHSVKNELILGRRVGRYHDPARKELAELLRQIPVRPWLVEQLLPELLPEAA